MKVQQLNEIRREDMPKAPEWVDPILTTLNSFIRSTYQILMGRLDIYDNLDEEIVTLPTINSNDIPSDGYKIRLKRIKKVPVGCQLAQIRVKSEGNHTIVSGAGYVDWLFEDGFLKIYQIAGLTTTDHYVALRVF